MGPLSATRLRSSPRRSHLGGNDSPPRSPSSSRAARVRELDAEVDRMEAELRDLGHFSDVTKAPPLSETRLSARS